VGLGTLALLIVLILYAIIVVGWGLVLRRELADDATEPVEKPE
jgi:hypothetical protein